MKSSIRFVGGVGTVTGSRHQVTVGSRRVLLDCGMFQGPEEVRQRNWRLPGADPGDVDAVLLSHAHLDHSGLLPVLVRQGFSGPIHCTAATADLAAIVLRDAGHLQEEDAARANRHGYSRHQPALPLYTLEEAEAVLPLFRPHPYGEPFEVVPGMSALFRRAGHILGSATIDLDLGTTGRLVFSGDLGRWDRPILKDPEPVPEADVLLVESTYGDRLHSADSAAVLADLVSRAVDRGGAIIVPAFAIGRTQELLWTLRQLEDAGRVPKLPVYLDSPMASAVTDIYCRHPEDHDLDMELLMDEQRCPLCSHYYITTRLPVESKAINDVKGACLIIAGSGMVNGGRVLHHLKERLSDERTTVLLSGYQAVGTRGRLLQDGAEALRIHGQDVRVRARIETITGLSAHADQSEILRWLRGFRRAPRQTWIVHGEPAAAATLARVISRDLGWRVDVANEGIEADLEAGRS
ncbi:MAG: Ribonuclease [Fimbriimonadaceae bacterium]|nr:Ribonuclease [Fimbriimonadaceae bacterium]MCC6622261.1 MBL fold metallo-hydrolase [Deltaproteobacteria bacterium]